MAGLDFPYESDMIITRILATFHPKGLQVDFVDFDDEVDREDSNAWDYRSSSAVWELEADHIVVRSVSIDDQGIPFAKKSLMIEFSDNAAPHDWHWTPSLALRMELREDDDLLD